MVLANLMCAGLGLSTCASFWFFCFDFIPSGIICSVFGLISGFMGGTVIFWPISFVLYILAGFIEIIIGMVVLLTLPLNVCCPCLWSGELLCFSFYDVVSTGCWVGAAPWILIVFGLITGLIKMVIAQVLAIIGLIVSPILSIYCYFSCAFIPFDCCNFMLCPPMWCIFSIPICFLDICTSSGFLILGFLGCLSVPIWGIPCCLSSPCWIGGAGALTSCGCTGMIIPCGMLIFGSGYLSYSSGGCATTQGLITSLTQMPTLLCGSCIGETAGLAQQSMAMPVQAGNIGIGCMNQAIGIWNSIAVCFNSLSSTATGLLGAITQIANVTFHCI